MNNRRWLIHVGLALVVALLLSPCGRAQDDGGAATQGIDSGNYNIQQTIDFGYRLNEVGGNYQTYDTFVNLQSGVRLFDYSLDMRSLNHDGLFFDNLHFSNFGYGGDPNDVSRLHIDKNKWYEFNLLFRRDANFWDYNLFANPLNPAPLNPIGSLTTGCYVGKPTTAFPQGAPAYCSNPSIAATTSLHSLNLVRRMQDYDLMLFPQSRLRFRLGYSHDRDLGPGFLTGDIGGSNGAFPEAFSYSMNAYRAGVDFRFLPRTTISYDQFLEYFKQDNTATLNPVATPGLFPYQLSTGTPVNLGYIWSTQTAAETYPCATPFSSTSTTPPTATSVCNGYLSYSLTDGRARTSMPTERLSFQSNYFEKFEMSGSAGYSSSDEPIPDIAEVLNGFATRTATRESTTGGPAKATRVSVDANWSGVYSVNDKFRIEDFFHYNNWRTPGVWDTFETNIFGTAGTAFSGLTLPLSLFSQVSSSAASTFAALCPAAPYNQAGCPLHTSSSGADVTNEITDQFLGENLKSNTFKLEYDFTKRVTGYIGYLYENRAISQFSATFDTGETYFPGGTGATAATDYFAARGDCALVGGLLPSGCTKNADGSITEGSPTDLVPEAGNDTARVVTTINTQALLAGVIARPTDQLRVSGDITWGYSDGAFTRIDPRQVQGYVVSATYTPKPWATLDGGFEIHENRDNVATVNNLEHDRAYSFTAMLAPNPKLAVSFGYNYWNVYTQSDVCFNFAMSSANPSGAGNITAVAVPPGVNAAVNTTICPVADYGSTNALEALSVYASTDHFAHADVMWKPTKRVTTTIGYGGSFVRGNTIFINPLTPSGTLDYDYQMPYASVTVQIYKGVSYKTAWNYYGFNETGLTNPFGLAAIPLQDFNGSNATFSIRYSF
jgi:hypothetical protein